MTQVNDKCIYLCGPYKDYCGHAEYDHQADIFHGEVGGTRDVITFQGRTIPDLRKAFQDSVDDYLVFCEERGESPEKPFSGKFVTRIEPSLHRKISQLAQTQGKSLNQLVGECLQSVAEEWGRSPPQRRGPASAKRTSKPRASRSSKASTRANGTEE